MITGLTTADACAAVARASRVADVLGHQPDARELRDLQALVHPDRCGGDQTAWDRLAALVQLDRPQSPSAPADFEPLELKYGPRRYLLTKLLARGDVADIYETEHEVPAVAKVAGSPADRDLLDAEAHALGAIHGDAALAGLRRLVPQVFASFDIKTPRGRRRVNVLPRAADMVTLADIRAAFPAGLDYRDAVWMIRRLLGALGLAHTRGQVHGAVTPEHVMVRLADHGALLVGWGCAVESGKPARALVPKYRSWFPPEVAAKRPLAPATDIYMAGRCFAYLLGADSTLSIPAVVPREIRAFVHGCCIDNPARRPAAAWDLHDDLGKIMESLVGAPKFRVLAMPPTPT